MTQFLGVSGYGWWMYFWGVGAGMWLTRQWRKP